MPTIRTLGNPGVRKRFSYSGCVENGVTLLFTGKPYISPEFFVEILANFCGTTILGGFSMTNPQVGGLGHWVKENSRQRNRQPLTPRHASFIAALLVYENKITSSLDGNSVRLHFP
jgi:hypothetical protein